MWSSGSPHSTKARSQRGGLGFDPHGLHTILNNNQYNGATCQPMTGPRGTTPLTKNDSTCHITIQPHLAIKNCHIITCHISVRTYGLYHIIVRPLPRQPIWTTQSSSFFAYLMIRIDRDISCSRRPFETK